MTTKIWHVEFDNGFHKNEVVAKTAGDAEKIARALFRKDTEDYVKEQIEAGKDGEEYSTWQQYVRAGNTQVTKVELVAESDN